MMPGMSSDDRSEVDGLDGLYEVCDPDGCLPGVWNIYIVIKNMRSMVVFFLKSLGQIIYR